MSDMDMGDDDVLQSPGFPGSRGQGIRFLVESALRKVASNVQEVQPRTRRDWIEHLCAALVSESDTGYRAAIASLIATGVSQREVLQSFIPEASRTLGEMWVQDRASFIDVTLGASRLQAIYREYEDQGDTRWLDRSIPLGQSVLMVIPQFEQHSLGAFVAADQLRRYGLWVHMGIGLDHLELTRLVAHGGFSMIGLSLATAKTVEKVTGLIDHVRKETPDCPPIVIGGRAVEDARLIERRTGADHAVKSISEAVQRCGLGTIGRELPIDSAL